MGAAECIGSGQVVAFSERVASGPQVKQCRLFGDDAPPFLGVRCAECGQVVELEGAQGREILAPHVSSSAEGRRSGQRAIEAARRAEGD